MNLENDADADPPDPSRASQSEGMLGQLVPYQPTAQQRVDTIVKRVTAKFELTNKLQGRSNTSLYIMLAEIWAQSAIIDKDPEMKYVLWFEVNKNKKLPLKWRKKAQKKSAAVLLLVLLYGLDKASAAHRSQLLRAVKGGLAKGVGPSKEEYFQWIEPRGVRWAGSHHKAARATPQKPTLTEVVQHYDDLPEDNAAEFIQLPRPIAFKSGFAALLVRNPEEGKLSESAKVELCGHSCDDDVLQMLLRANAEHRGFLESRAQLKSRRGSGRYHRPEPSQTSSDPHADGDQPASMPTQDWS